MMYLNEKKLIFLLLFAIFNTSIVFNNMFKISGQITFSDVNWWLPGLVWKCEFRVDLKIHNIVSACGIHFWTWWLQKKYTIVQSGRHVWFQWLTSEVMGEGNCCIPSNYEFDRQHYLSYFSDWLIEFQVPVVKPTD